jgi:hypothetical protein
MPTPQRRRLRARLKRPLDPPQVCLVARFALAPRCQLSSCCGVSRRAVPRILVGLLLRNSQDLFNSRGQSLLERPLARRTGRQPAFKLSYRLLRLGEPGEVRDRAPAKLRVVVRIGALRKLLPKPLGLLLRGRMVDSDCPRCRQRLPSAGASQPR